MELELVFKTGKMEIHEGWYNRRIQFRVVKYANGQEWLSIFDYHEGKTIIEKEITPAKDNNNVGKNDAAI